MKTTTNPHKWLFAHLSIMQGYEDRDEARKALVYDYSGGETESLSVLFDKYPRAYNAMRKDLSKSKKAIDSPSDAARKKLIAAIFGNLEQRDYKPTMEYVKAVACKGARVVRFNDIPLDKLKDLYNRFKNKNLQHEVDDLINSI